MLQALTIALSDVFFPRICFCCNFKLNCFSNTQQHLTLNDFICQNCQSNIEYLTPFSQYPPNSNYQALICATANKEPLTTLIKLFKYKQVKNLARPLAQLMIQHLLRSSFNPKAYDIITAIALHPSKEKERGYNQAQLLAQNIATYFQIRYQDDIIYRVGSKPSQTGLDRNKRQINVKDLFAVKKMIPGKNIIIIDDVFTTGATLNAAAQAAKKAQAAKITAFTLAKTL